MALCLVGLVVLLQLHLYAAIVALASLAPVAAYPFMKRITWWPQAWLGLVFSWAALVGWSEVAGALTLPGLLLYAGSIAWVIGYDTIYALQDREDDALIGVRSSALRMGAHVRRGVGAFYAARPRAMGGGVLAGPARPAGAGRAAAGRAASRVAGRDAARRRTAPTRCTGSARNRFAGLLMFLACVVVGTSCSSSPCRGGRRAIRALHP